jgi:hypothetical protein
MVANWMTPPSDATAAQYHSPAANRACPWATLSLMRWLF